MADNISLPVSSLNKLRRDGLDVISRQILESYSAYTVFSADTDSFFPHKAADKKRYARFSSTKIGSGFRELDLCFIPYNSPPEEAAQLIKRGFRIGVEIPRAMFSRENDIIKKLRELKKLGINDVLCNNLAAVHIAKSEGFLIHGGFGLNFTNTLDLLWAEEYGFEDTELSFEIKKAQFERLGGTLPRGIISFGYIPVMLTRNCPNKSVNLGCEKCRGQSKTKDRLGKSFIFYCDGYATEILNSVPLDALTLAEGCESLDFDVLRFSVENYVEKVESFCDFIGVEAKLSEKTHGLYLRGVQ